MRSFTIFGQILDSPPFDGHEFKIVPNKDIFEIKAEIKLLQGRFSVFQRAINKDFQAVTGLKGLDIPFNTIEELEDFDKKLLNENFYKDVLNYTANIGGLDFKHFTRRTLGRYFSHDLGRIYSWTGQKHNYRLKDLKSFQLIRDLEAVMVNYTISEWELETSIKEWFRHCNTRLKRLSKK